MKLYVGKRGGRHVLGCELARAQRPFSSWVDSEFTQFIKGYQGERLRQAFHFFDQDGDGYINPDEFQKIIVVSRLVSHAAMNQLIRSGSRRPQAVRLCSRSITYLDYPEPGKEDQLFRSYRFP